MVVCHLTGASADEAACHAPGWVKAAPIDFAAEANVENQMTEEKWPYNLPIWRRSFRLASPDGRKTAEIAPFIDAFRAMTEAVSSRTTEEKKNAIEMYRWMIEEFKVSLFAQELKTAFPISAIRLKKKIREID